MALYHAAYGMTSGFLSTARLQESGAEQTRQQQTWQNHVQRRHSVALAVIYIAEVTLWIQFTQRSKGWQKGKDGPTGTSETLSTVALKYICAL